MQGVCQALGKGTYSLIISLLRFIVLALPLAWALSMLPNAADVIWAALPIAEAGACAAAVILTKKAYKAAM